MSAETQQLKLELETSNRTRKTLEHENATLLERVNNFEQQKVLFFSQANLNIFISTHTVYWRVGGYGIPANLQHCSGGDDPPVKLGGENV